MTNLMLFTLNQLFCRPTIPSIFKWGLFFLFLNAYSTTTFAQCSCPFEIGEDINSVTLASQVPLPFPFVTNCVTIRGTLIIDRPITFAGSSAWPSPSIRMGEGAHIIIRPGVNSVGLGIFYDCNISACEGKMWKGITVEDGGNLFFNQNDISDAQYALEILDGATVTMDFNNFDLNYVSVYTPDLTTGEHLVNLQSPIIGNTFDCSANLLPPFLNQTPSPETRSFAGVFLNDAIGLSIGNENDATFPNQFRNQRNGIIATNSILTVDDATIENHPINCPVDLLSSDFFDVDHLKGFGIYVANSPHFSQRNCTLKDCCFGTYVKSADVVNITDSDYQTGMTYGIRLNQLGNTFTQNTISGNALNCAYRGIEAFYVILAKELTIEGNDKITLHHPRSKAIALENVISLPFPTLDLPIIENNVIEM